MSLITDVVVVAMCGEDAAIDRVNEQLLARLDMSAAGGFKAISARVYAASFNYGDIPALEQYLTDAPWRLPRSVTVCIDGENYDSRIFPGVTETL